MKPKKNIFNKNNKKLFQQIFTKNVNVCSEKIEVNIWFLSDIKINCQCFRLTFYVYTFSLCIFCILCKMYKINFADWFCVYVQYILICSVKWIYLYLLYFFDIWPIPILTQKDKRISWLFSISFFVYTLKFMFEYIPFFVYMFSFRSIYRII